MALKFTGTGTRSGGVYQAIAKQVKLLNLEPVNKITFKFDPFGDNAAGVRQFLYVLKGKAPIKTNPACKINATVICDRSEPTVDVKLNNGESIFFKCRNLTPLDMVKLFNQHITVLAPKPVETTASAIETKITKKALKKR